jgi:3-oxoacyl-[acyl-carrier-protein] synthase III
MLESVLVPEQVPAAERATARSAAIWSVAIELPVALAAAELNGRLRLGAKVVLSAFGAGFTWGGGVIEWGGVESV